MQALRYVTESVNHQVVIQLPPELDYQRLEIIVLPLGENLPVQAAIPVRRNPSPLLAGSVVMADDQPPSRLTRYAEENGDDARCGAGESAA
jgi:hypothetical protein